MLAIDYCGDEHIRNISDEEKKRLHNSIFLLKMKNKKMSRYRVRSETSTEKQKPIPVIKKTE